MQQLEINDDLDTESHSSDYFTPSQSSPTINYSNDQHLRQLIQDIQNNINLSPTDKAKNIQSLMTSGWSKIKNQLMDIDYNVSDTLPTFHNQSSNTLGCSHYQRKVKIKSSCCDRWFTCRFCHNDACDHELDRTTTQSIMCMLCSFIQSPSQECSNCHQQLAHYYCSTCKFWDDDSRKSIFHCQDCGICRVGKGLGIDFFHCDKCNICMAISMKGNHKCIERNLESDCPICGDYMFTSTSTVIFMPCGHCIHHKCHSEYILTNYQCPTCFKSLSNMSEYFQRIDSMLQSHEMPAEYRNTQSIIYCNDCETKSIAKFHFLYHKCGSCSGYNTKVLKTVENSDKKNSTPTTEIISAQDHLDLRHSDPTFEQ